MRQREYSEKEGARKGIRIIGLCVRMGQCNRLVKKIKANDGEDVTKTLRFRKYLIFLFSCSDICRLFVGTHRKDTQNVAKFAFSNRYYTFKINILHNAVRKTSLLRFIYIFIPLTATLINPPKPKPRDWLYSVYVHSS